VVDQLEWQAGWWPVADRGEKVLLSREFLSTIGIGDQLLWNEREVTLHCSSREVDHPGASGR
jgi:hypothetical protein